MNSKVPSIPPATWHFAGVKSTEIPPHWIPKWVHGNFDNLTYCVVDKVLTSDPPKYKGWKLIGWEAGSEFYCTPTNLDYSQRFLDAVKGWREGRAGIQKANKDAMDVLYEGFPPQCPAADIKKRVDDAITDAGVLLDNLQKIQEKLKGLL